MALRTVFAIFTTGVVLQASALAGAGIASAELGVPPEIAAAVCPGGRFHPVTPSANSFFAYESAMCVVYGSGGAEDNISMDLMAYETPEQLAAEVKTLKKRHYPIFAYATGQGQNPIGVVYLLMVASAFVVDPPPSVRPFARKLIARMGQFGFKIYDG